MKKTVFANWGSADQGKSSTVKEIAKLIIDNYPECLKDPDIINYEEDIKVVVTIGKIKIGLESQGDPPGIRLIQSLKEFVKIKCDIIICATRTSGKTVDAVNDLHYKNGYDNVWLTNYRSNEKNRDALNSISANHIFELIQQNIKGNI